MKRTIIGLDIAKRKMYFVVQEGSGKTLYRKSCKSEDLIKLLSMEERGVIALEACGGSSYWGRKLRELGFEVRHKSAQGVEASHKAEKRLQRLCGHYRSSESRGDKINWYK